MEFLEILKFFAFFLFPVQVKALLILLTRGQEAAAEYKRQQFAQMVNEFVVEHNQKTKEIKTKLFEDFTRIESKDPQLRAQGKIRILEIGIGPGANLQFYPPNCHVVAVDYNTAFEKIVREKVKLYPGMTLEDFHITSAANMPAVPSESIDVVVSTVVLCSISDVKGVIQEVHRVLAPGGRYCYMEHILEKPKTMLNLIQTVLDKLRIWPYFFDGCRFKALDRILKDKTPFSSVEQKIVYIDTSGMWVWYFVHTHLAGVQIK